MYLRTRGGFNAAKSLGSQTENPQIKNPLLTK
jgi:hypothetical protein